MATLSASGSRVGVMVCCECGVDIDTAVNPTSTCVSCLRARVNITDGVACTGSVHRCRRCGRYQTGNTAHAWLATELESKELMALCLKKIKGLKRVKVADAAWVWTEPHAMRLKLRLTVQKEVYNGAVLQQILPVELVVRNLQCADCAAQFASMAWKASVQVRQRVEHKRTFFYLEQVVLKHDAQRSAVKIEQFRDGLDFFFKEKNDAMRFVTFLEAEVPTKTLTSKKLVSQDDKSNIFNHQYTSLVELAPACKDDLVLLDARTAKHLGDIKRVVLVRSVNSEVRIVEPQTGQIAEMTALAYWKHEPSVMITARQLTSFIVLDVEPRVYAAPKRRSAKSICEDAVQEVAKDQVSLNKKKRRRNEQPKREGPRLGKGFVADVTLARSSDLGVNDDQITVATHMGALLRAGDEVLGYDLRAANLASANSLEGVSDVPDVVLVRKAPTKINGDDGGTERRKRKWKLRSLNAQDADEFKNGNSKADAAKREQDYEIFLQQLESDKEMRSKIGMFKISDDVNDDDLDPHEGEHDEHIKLDELLDSVKFAEAEAPFEDSEPEDDEEDM
ncbi:NMD3 family-domain-containing protein [Pelagophyceae sp. CCMP2097]|nr:NMD3 family-domain-containing protein [Pelagophyceae sp. CCMP2097]